jgi:alpha-tubulin suppressor-like RCC1 family protein
MLRRTITLIALVLVAATAASAQAATPMLALSESGPSGGSTCVLTQSGKVFCWGDNGRGQLGTSVADDGNGVAAPQLVPLPKAAVQIAAGASHNCALLEDASVYCWGQNYFGQLGNSGNNGTLNANPTPSAVPLSKPVSQLSAGGMDTCFIYVDGTVGCLGDNSFGQLGSSPMNQTNFTPVTMALGASSAKKVVIGDNFSCTLLTTLSIKCTGFNPAGQLANSAHLHTGGATPVTAGLAGPPIDVATGGGHACAILQDLTTWCWGSNGSGQLGNGSADSADHYNPVKVAIGNAQLLALGTGHTCARLIAGGVDCWGGNLTGQLGVSDNILTFDPNPTPLLSAIDANATAIEAGGPHTCVIIPAGNVRCVGDNSTSELGVPKADLGYSYIPVTVPGVNLLDASAASAKLKLVVADPKFKFKKAKGKITATARMKLSGVGGAIPAADCAGKATTKFERKLVSGKGKKRNTSYKKLVSKTAKLGEKKGQCGFDVKLTVAGRYAGKKLTLRVILKDGAHTTGFDTRFTAKIKSH